MNELGVRRVAAADRVGAGWLPGGPIDRRVAARGWCRAPVAVLVVASLIAGCGDGATTGDPLPAVDVSSVLRRDPPAGNGVPQATAGDGLAADYVETEFLMEGVASTYAGPPTGPVTRVADGIRYVTRVLVRHPRDAGRFSGRVLIEPFNTSAFVDRGVVWLQTAPFLQAEGDAWIGVTVRVSSDQALKDADPVRYAPVRITTNDVAWDMLRQIGAVVKQGGPQSPLPNRKPSHVYMVGYSQSGLDTATFAMAFATLTGTADGGPVFDGYLPAAHSGSVTSVAPGPGILATFEHFAMTAVPVPVVDLETQSDVEGFMDPLYTSPSGAEVRRADSDEPGDLYRLYEIAGAAHSQRNPNCEGDGTSFPTFRFVRGALARLYRWAEEGVLPPRADRIEAARIGTVSVMKVDGDGNAVGGVRSPFIDVPLSRFVVSVEPGPFCAFTGDEIPFPPDVLRARYADVAGFMARFEERLDATIEAGFLLEGDREEILRSREEMARDLFG